MITDRAANSLAIEGNISGESFRAGIDDENMAHIISLFTDLYSDPILAVIREYSTNAVDAQIEAGVDAPIEVTLPTPLSPFFKVKDRGVGLDKDDIAKIYSRYGTSTKRATNDQNGMLGLGCKSALTYTHQFTVRSVKDGVAMVCSISREADGVPVMTVVGEPEVTMEDSGTEVMVPVKRGHEDSFTERAAKFYAVWDVDAVRVNGEKPKRLPEGLRLSDEITIYPQPHRGYGQRPTPNQVVMGNVTYPIDHEMASAIGNIVPGTHYILARVPIGSVNFTPSREALMYTRTTKTTLEKLVKDVEVGMTAAVQAEVDKATTRAGAIRAAAKWRSLLGNRIALSAFKYNGADIPDLLKFADKDDEDGSRIIHTRRNSTKLSANHVSRAVEGVSIPDTLFVQNYTQGTFTAQHKRKLVKYMEDNKLFADKSAETYYNDFALVAVPIKHEWVPTDQVIDWDDVRQVKLPVNRTGRSNYSNRPTGAYDVWVGGNASHMQAAAIDTTKKIFYVEGRNRHEASSIANMICAAQPDAYLVCLPWNRVGKFKRNFPMAKRYSEAIQESYEKWVKSLTKDQIRALALAHTRSGEYVFTEVPEDPRILDKQLLTDIKLWKSVDVTSINIKLGAFYRNGVSAANTGTILASMSKSAQVPDYRAKYPLIEHISVYGARRQAIQSHLIMYLNAAHAASLTPSV